MKPKKSTPKESKPKKDFMIVKVVLVPSKNISQVPNNSNK